MGNWRKANMTNKLISLVFLVLVLILCLVGCAKTPENDVLEDLGVTIDKDDIDTSEKKNYNISVNFPRFLERK